VNTNRGGIYWPHKSTTTVGMRRMNYVLISEGTGVARFRPAPAGRGDAVAAPTIQMTDISVICHELGHILGLPDLYARPEDPGSEGLGVWCVMSQALRSGRPQHMSVWCKEQLGWVHPVVINPTVKQKLVLGPIEDSPNEAYKIPLKSDGSEYFLLENRCKKGFDASLPAEGLLIWRVTRNRPLLEESHGISGPQGPQAFPASVPFPSIANDSFTPYTTPSSRSRLGSSSTVYLTNIKRMADSRISFWIGYVFD
jgi:immune inhibitor A